MAEQIKITSMVIPGSEGTVSFDAYITDMGQTFSSTWNSEDVFGRNDPIATFQGTKRTISLSFDVPSGNAAEAKQNLKKCSKLATFLYPGYSGLGASGGRDEQYGTNEKDGITIVANRDAVSSVGNISRPPLVKIKFANLINSIGNSKTQKKQGLLGFIDSYTFTPVMDAGLFGGANLYPRTITVSLSFTALHQKTPGHVIDPDDGDDDEFKVVWHGDRKFFE